MTSTSKDKLTSPKDPNKDEDLIKDYFPYDSDVTDFTLIVEGKKLHVAKVVLIDASPVFRKMQGNSNRRQCQNWNSLEKNIPNLFRF